MGDAIRAVIDSLYTRLIMRDVIGKVVPGAVTLLALSERFPLASGSIASQQIPNSLLIALGIGVSWITALVLQSLGEALRVIRYWPAEFGDATKRYELRVRFLQVATLDEKQQVERFSILMEASALSCMSLLVASLVRMSLIVPTVFTPPPPVEQMAFIAVLLTAAFALWRFHRTHREKLYAFLGATCNLRPMTPLQVAVIEGSPTVQQAAVAREPAR